MQAAEEIAQLTQGYEIALEDGERQLKEAAHQLQELQAQLNDSEQLRRKDKQDAAEELSVMQRETLSLNATMTKVHNGYSPLAHYWFTTGVPGCTC